MKKTVIIALLCINVALVATLMVVSSQPAKAQTFSQTDYLTATGIVDQNVDALWIIDLAKKRMTALRFDLGRRHMTPSPQRRLDNDFQEQPRRRGR